MRYCFWKITAVLLLVHTPILHAEERTQRFDADPGWDGHNHRLAESMQRAVTQDFGYSETQHCGGATLGEVGGLLTPAGEPAYYAKHIKQRTLDDTLTASGKVACTGRHFHVLVGFFNADTVNEWRVPNSVVLRLYGRGDVFYAYLEYTTGRWRAGADTPGGFATTVEPDTGRQQLRGFTTQGDVHTWSLKYDPAANNGQGSITATIDGETAVCHLEEGHKQDGAHFNRFGLLNIPKHHDQGGEVWLDDITVDEESFDFSSDPNWDAVGNRRTYRSADVRPAFDFGFSDTRYAGGQKSGELGGVVFRGDNRDPRKLAYYGDRLENLSNQHPLRASGKIALRRGVSDSTTLIGFFHSQKSIEVSDSQSSALPLNFVGMAIEGPSREGFLAYPAYRFASSDGYARGSNLPHILPDGSAHNWSLELRPDESKLLLLFDEQKVELPIPVEHLSPSTEFDRFGIITTWIDGNGQRIYFDDLTYTFSQTKE